MDLRTCIRGFAVAKLESGDCTDLISLFSIKHREGAVTSTRAGHGTVLRCHLVAPSPVPPGPAQNPDRGPRAGADPWKNRRGFFLCTSSFVWCFFFLPGLYEAKHKKWIVSICCLSCLWHKGRRAPNDTKGCSCWDREELSLFCTSSTGETEAAAEGWEALQNHLCATQSFYLLAFKNLQEASKQTPQQRETAHRLPGMLPTVNNIQFLLPALPLGAHLLHSPCLFSAPASVCLQSPAVWITLGKAQVTQNSWPFLPSTGLADTPRL